MKYGKYGNLSSFSIVILTEKFEGSPRVGVQTRLDATPSLSFRSTMFQLM